MTFESTFLRTDLFGTRTMLLKFDLLAIKMIGLALTLFLSVVEIQLIVALHWICTSVARPIRIWFPKRRRKPPGPTTSNNNHGKRGSMSSEYLHFLLFFGASITASAAATEIVQTSFGGSTGATAVSHQALRPANSSSSPCNTIL